jgi:hypothetical protein
MRKERIGVFGQLRNDETRRQRCEDAASDPRQSTLEAKSPRGIRPVAQDDERGWTRCEPDDIELALCFRNRLNRC